MLKRLVVAVLRLHIKEFEILSWVKMILVGADLTVHLFLDEKNSTLGTNLGTCGWISASRELRGPWAKPCAEKFYWKVGVLGLWFHVG